MSLGRISSASPASRIRGVFSLKADMGHHGTKVILTFSVPFLFPGMTNKMSFRSDWVIRNHAHVPMSMGNGMPFQKPELGHPTGKGTLARQEKY